MAMGAILAFGAGICAQNTVRTYTDLSYGFTVEYAKDFNALKGAKAKTETAFGDPGIGTKILKVTPLRIPAKYHGEYEFSVWSSTNARKTCGAPAANERIGNISIEAPAEDEQQSVRIAGRKFYAFTGSEGGMSKSLSLLGYRALVDKKCWLLLSLTYQVSAFDDFKAFDDKIIRRSFDDFADSFKFTHKK
jgi:hypothetical protein